MAARLRLRALAVALLVTLSLVAACGSGATQPRAAQVGASQRPTAPSSPDSPSSVPTPSTSSTSSGPPSVGSHPVTALFFGDSYIVGGAYTGPDDSMGAIAARRLGWSYQIRGGGGTGFVTANPQYNLPTFLGQIQAGALDVGPVDWLVIEGGGADKTDDPAVITQDAVTTLRAAAAAHPEARLVLVGTMDPTVDGFTDTDGVIGALAAAAQQVGIPYIDAQHWLEGHPDLVGPDYDHPTPAGHRLCGRKLARALQALE